MLIVIVIVLAGVFVAGDRIAVAYAQGVIASKIQAQGHLEQKPTVTIEGFPFLTQVAARDVRKVTISTRDVTEGRLVISGIDATATGVRLSASFNRVTIGQITGQAVITYPALDYAVGIPGGARITPDPSAGHNGVTVSVAGGLASASGQVILVSATRAILKVEKLGGLAGLLGGTTTGSYVLVIPALPAGLKVTSLSLTARGVVLVAAAKHTVLSQ